jgi:5-guanidino-2-oxopentanoate decarboxylase
MENAYSGAQILVETLVEVGADTVFGIPGIHNLTVYQALLDSPLRHVTSRNEAGAGFMADGFGRSTGRPGVALVITGPGLTNIITALGEAYRDAVPLLVISSQVPRTHLERNTGYLHDLKNSTIMLSSVTKESRSVSRVEMISETVRQAYALAQAGRPGPVHLEIPLDVLEEASSPEPAAGSGFPGPSAEALVRAVDLVRHGSRPLLLVGGGAAMAGPEVLRLARLLDAPVVTTAAGKGVVEERDPLCLGGRLHLPAVRSLIEKAEPLIVLGSELSPTDLWFDDLPVTGRVVNINAEPMDLYRTLRPTVGVTGRLEALLPALIDAIATGAGQRGPREQGPRQAPDGASLVNEAIRQGTNELPGVLGQTPARVARMREVLLAIRRALPEEGLLSIDMTTIAYVALSEFPAYRPRSFLHPVGFGTLGYALPAGIGAKVAEPPRPVAVVTGDGGFQFTMQELGVAAQEGIALPLIIWDDDGYGEIRRTEDERHPGRRIAVDNKNPDFLALAEAYGIPGSSPKSPAEIERRVAAVLKGSGPEIIQIRGGTE